MAGLSSGCRGRAGSSPASMVRSRATSCSGTPSTSATPNPPGGSPSPAAASPERYRTAARCCCAAPATLTLDGSPRSARLPRTWRPSSPRYPTRRGSTSSWAQKATARACTTRASHCFCVLARESRRSRCAPSCRQPTPSTPCCPSSTACSAAPSTAAPRRSGLTPTSGSSTACAPASPPSPWTSWRSTDQFSPTGSRSPSSTAASWDQTTSSSFPAERSASPRTDGSSCSPSGSDPGSASGRTTSSDEPSQRLCSHPFRPGCWPATCAATCPATCHGW